MQTNEIFLYFRRILRFCSLILFIIRFVPHKMILTKVFIYDTIKQYANQEYNAYKRR